MFSAVENKVDYTDLLGARFKYQGISRSEGFDCWGLCREIYRRLGRELPPFAYTDTPGRDTLHGLIMSGREFCQKLPRPEPYCLVAFRLVPNYVTHVGVVLEDCQTFIHILKKSSVTVERLDSFIWKKKIDGFYRWI